MNGEQPQWMVNSPNEWWTALMNGEQPQWMVNSPNEWWMVNNPTLMHGEQP